MFIFSGIPVIKSNAFLHALNLANMNLIHFFPKAFSYDVFRENIYDHNVNKENSLVIDNVALTSIS